MGFQTRNWNACPHHRVVHSDRNKVTCLFRGHIGQIKCKNNLAVSDFRFILLVFHMKYSLPNVLFTNPYLTFTYADSCDIWYVNMIQDTETYVKYIAYFHCRHFLYMCVCVCVCVCVYIYIYIYISLYKHLVMNEKVISPGINLYSCFCKIKK